jgi:signal transduction histidine kinase
LGALGDQDGHNPENVYESHLIISDITKYTIIKEQLKLNEQIMLAQAHKAGMGELISMIAHQWRQPLNNLALVNQDMYIKLELGKLDDKSVYASHEKIDEILQFMSKTIDDFRNFFSPDQPKEWITVEEVINCTLKIIGQCYVTTNIAINVHNNSKTPLLIHKNSLVQVFLNILGNAKQALESSGVKPAIITIIIDETPSSIITTIRDNGGGIPEKIIDKIADPYFTTKGLMGTGLGLYITQTIIEKYFSGSFTWFNKNQGASFVITLDKKDV